MNIVKQRKSKIGRIDSCFIVLKKMKNEIKIEEFIQTIFKQLFDYWKKAF
jgi:hypothetical protein